MIQLHLLLLLLAAAVLAVVICRRFKLPAMLGYLLVGLLIGPHTLKLVPSSEAVSDLAEFGVVFLMFTLGLEFNLAKLHAMRRIVFGFGSLHVGGIVLLTLLATALTALGWKTGLALGGALAMSSTAMASRLLAERHEINSPHGQNTIGVLLFQDLAVVPFLIMIPVLGMHGSHLAGALGMAAFKIAAVLVLLLYLGQKMIRPWFNLVAKQHSSELFMLNLLLVSLGIAWLTEEAGLSLALGAFLAGMLIAETDFRYQVEDDIRPFRDLLLGLFFVTVGMTLDFGTLLSQWKLVLLLLLALGPGKIALTAALAHRFGSTPGNSWRTGFYLGQGGEFAFVMLALAVEHQLITGATQQASIAAIVLSMLATPFFVQHSDKLVLKLANSEWMHLAANLHAIAVRTMQSEGHVVLCGFGRNGQSLARLLSQENIYFFALDLDPEKVREAAAAGESVVFGDAAKREVLIAAGLMRAKALVITYNNTHSAMKILELVHQLRPGLPVIVRTPDDSDIEKLKQGGATEVVADTLESSLMLAAHTLMLLGTPHNKVFQHIREVREARYSLFRGFFQGNESPLEGHDHPQPRLQTVHLPSNAFAVGQQIGALSLEKLGVEVRAIRRRNTPPIQPQADFELLGDDVLVLYGEQENLEAAEKLLLQGDT